MSKSMAIALLVGVVAAVGIFLEQSRPDPDPAEIEKRRQAEHLVLQDEVIIEERPSGLVTFNAIDHRNGKSADLLERFEQWMKEHPQMELVTVFQSHTFRLIIYVRSKK